MFLFTDDSSELRPRRLVESAQAFGPVTLISSGSAALVWTDDGFTACEREGDCIRVLMRRPRLDVKPLLTFEWNMAAQMIFCRRNWSGELQAWFRQGPAATVTSHLKLPACVLREFSPGWK